MTDRNRTIQELLSDYAGALRDGCVPVFLKSLTRQEGQAIASSGEFWGTTELVRILNGVGFANKAVTADVGLFTSRVDANIASRLKKSKTSSRPRRTSIRKSVTRPQRTEETI
jgi:hypothetical protein